MRTLPLAAAALLAAATPALAGELTVTLAGIAHDKGGIRVGLYDRAETFRKEDKAVAVLAGPATPGQASVVFADVPAGRYAVMAYHDEDGDGGLDRFMGMIPTEGYALSNDPEVSGPPAFDQCAFEVPAEGRTLTVTVKY